MKLFGSDRQDQVVRVFRGTCKNGTLVRAKLTIRFSKPQRSEAADALIEAAEALAQKLLAEAPNASVVVGRDNPLVLRLRAEMGARVPGASFELEMFGSGASITTATEVRRAQEETRGTVLVVDDEESVRVTIEGLLSDEFRVLLAVSAEDAEQVVLREQPHAVLADYELGGHTGLDLLARLRSLCPDAIGMLITGHHDYAEVIAAMGDDRIFRVILKPYDPAMLVATIRTAVSVARMRQRASKPPPG